MPSLLWLSLLGCPLVTEAQLDAVRDRDRDGEWGTAFGGADCDDDDPQVGGADVEEVFYDGVDADCGGLDPQGCAADGSPFDADYDADGDCVMRLDGGGGDCDDDDARVGGPTQWFVDRDGDGVAADDAVGVWACADDPAVAGYVTTLGDCDDSRADVHPGASEVCDAEQVDEDCDGLSDDDDPDAVGKPLVRFVDRDGDGWGGGEPSESFCDEPAARSDGAAWAERAGDCFDVVGDPGDPDQLYPGLGALFGPEQVHPTTAWYADRDLDGYGDPEGDSGVVGCDYVLLHAPNDDDCDDDDPDTRPGAVDPPMNLDLSDLSAFSFHDVDCAGDSEADLDGDGYPEPLSASVPGMVACPASPAVHRVSPGDSLQAVVDAAGPCDRVEVEGGSYGSVDIVRPLVLAAVPGDEVVIEAGEADFVGVRVASDDVVISGLTVRGFELGIDLQGQAMVENTVIDDGVLGVFAQSELVLLFDLTVRDQLVALELEGPDGLVIVSESRFEGIDAPFTAITSSEPTATLIVLSSEVRDSYALGGAIGGPMRALYLWSVDVLDHTGLALNAWGLTEGSVYDMEVRDSVAVGTSLVSLSGSYAVGSSVVVDSLRLVDDLGSGGGTRSSPGFLTVDGFDQTTLDRVELLGNSHLDASESPWVRSVGGPGSVRVLRNVVVGSSDGIGLAVQEAEVAQATVVGPRYAVWPLRDGGVGGASTLASSIVWGGEEVVLQGVGGLVAADGTVLDDASLTVVDGAVDPAMPCPAASCDTADPRFLRYHPSLRPTVWDLHLAPDSPYLGVQAPTPWPCASTDGAFGESMLEVVEDQLGGYGRHAFPPVPQPVSEPYLGPVPSRYSACFVGDPVVYDLWWLEFLTLDPTGDADGDGVATYLEFGLGTLPDDPDSDGDRVDDGDESPEAVLDPCDPDPCALTCTFGQGCTP